MKILQITEKIPQSSSLPDGIYQGIWSGYIIELKYNNKSYELKTETGVRGIGIKVIVTIKGEVASYETINN